MSDSGPESLVSDSVRVWISSPYPSVRAGLRVLLADDARLTIVGDGAGFPPLRTELLAAATVDVAIVDLPSPESLDDLLADAERLMANGVILLGAAPDDHHLLARLGPRPWGFLPREAEGEELAVAVQTVHAGLLAIDPGIAVQLFAVAGVRRPGPAIELEAIEDLTPREVEVLSLIAEGIPNKAIARRLAISEHTVKFHVGSVLSKLNAASRTEAVRIGARRGLIAL